MKLKLFLSLLFFAGAASVSWAAQKQLSPGHVPADVSQGQVMPWSRLTATNRLPLTLGLPLHHRAELANLLQSLYNPASPNYHHYLTPAEFATRFGPTAEDYAAILQFAATNHLQITRTTSNRMLVNVTGAASDIERAFHVRLKTFRHPRENRNFFAPDAEPTVDASLPLLDVSGLNNYELPHPCLQLSNHQNSGKPKALIAKPLIGSAPDGTYLGGDFRAAYVPGTILAGSGQAVGLFQLDGYDTNDIAAYAALAGQTNIPLQNILLNGVDGTPSTNLDRVAEVCLDIEMSMAMAPGLAQILVYEGTDPNTVLNQMAMDDAAEQLSCSWSWGSEPSATTDQIFQQMAAQGQSFFTASGDNDAYPPGTLDSAAVAVTPTDNPYVTSVGGTSLFTTGPGGSRVSENTWNWGYGLGTGGGSSTYYTIPEWQLGIDMSVNGGSTAYRNIPDVAFTADDIYIAYGSGYFTDAAGTSCAAPLWAAFTALANQQAAQLSQPPLGFLNPALYALGRGTNGTTVFNDITTGNNISYYSPSNYYAVAGYDLCTGWGTPNGTNLINALTTPDFLGVSGSTYLIASGVTGGPFAPTNWIVTLTNASATSLSWAAGSPVAWLTVSPANGTLPANGSVNLNVALTTAATTLPPANFSAPLEVTNLTTSRVQIAAVANLSIGQTIVLNGGFETGDFTGWTLADDTYELPAGDFYDAVSTGDEYPEIVHSGYFGAFLGEAGDEATLTQILPTTPGQKYLISCWLSNPESIPVQQFTGTWDGTNFVNLFNPPASDWVNIVYVATATVTNTVLQFGAENDANYFGFDDVSVLPVPPVKFSRLSQQTNGLQLSWFSLPALNYEVLYATNLPASSWNNLGIITASTNVTTLVDTNALNNVGSGFYRLLLLP